MKFEVYAEKGQKEETVYFTVGRSLLGVSLVAVNENGKEIGQIASIDSKGRLVLHSNLSTKIGLDLTPERRVVVDSTDLTCVDGTDDRKHYKMGSR